MSSEWKIPINSLNYSNFISLIFENMLQHFKLFSRSADFYGKTFQMYHRKLEIQLYNSVVMKVLEKITKRMFKFKFLKLTI